MSAPIFASLRGDPAGRISIRKALYGERPDVTKGFFSVKISTLSDILPAGSPLSDTFLFNLGTVESKKFQDFISYNTLDTAVPRLKRNVSLRGDPAGRISLRVEIFTEKKPFVTSGRSP